MEVTILKEQEYQPNSVVDKIVSRFEQTSVVTITRKDQIREIKGSPAFDAVYLVLFKTVSLFKSNAPGIRLQTMWPVVMCNSKQQVTEARLICDSVELPYKIIVNDFDREQAMAMIYSVAKEKVSESFAKNIIRLVGLSPSRIISALGICDAVGYTVAAANKYVDKYRRYDIHDTVRVILGACQSSAQYKRGMYNIELSIPWFRTYKKRVVKELRVIRQLYSDILEGELRSETLLSYCDSARVTLGQAMFALDLFNTVSLSSLLLCISTVENCKNALELVYNLNNSR